MQPEKTDHFQVNKHVWKVSNWISIIDTERKKRNVYNCCLIALYFLIQFHVRPSELINYEHSFPHRPHRSSLFLSASSCSVPFLLSLCRAFPQQDRLISTVGLGFVPQYFPLLVFLCVLPQIAAGCAALQLLSALNWANMLMTTIMMKSK